MKLLDRIKDGYGWKSYNRSMYEKTLKAVKDCDVGFDPNKGVTGRLYFKNENLQDMYAIHLVAYLGCEIELFKAILDKVTDVNVKGNFKEQTALMFVCQRPKADMDTYQNANAMVKLLLDHKDIDINEQDRDGNTAIMHALMAFGSGSRKKLRKWSSKKLTEEESTEWRKNGVEIMNKILNHTSFNWATVNNEGQNLLHIAALHGCEPETFENIIVKTGVSNDNDGDLLMILVKVVKTNDASDPRKEVTDPWPNVEYMMKTLLEKGTNPNKISKGYTPLILAVQRHNANTVELLLKHTTAVDVTIPFNPPTDKLPGFEQRALRKYMNKTAAEIAQIDRQYDILKFIVDYQTKLACQCSNLAACKKFKF